MTLFTARRQQALDAPESPIEQAGAKRKRRTLEDIYKLIDENLAILD